MQCTLQSHTLSSCVKMQCIPESHTLKCGDTIHSWITHTSVRNLADTQTSCLIKISPSSRSFQIIADANLSSHLAHNTSHTYAYATYATHLLLRNLASRLILTKTQFVGGHIFHTTHYTHTRMQHTQHTFFWGVSPIFHIGSQLFILAVYLSYS